MSLMLIADLKEAIRARLGLPTLDTDSTPTDIEVEQFIRTAEAYILSIVPPLAVPEAHTVYSTIESLNGTSRNRFNAIVSVARNGVQCAKGDVALVGAYSDPKSMHFASPLAPVYLIEGEVFQVLPPAGPVAPNGTPISTEVPFRAVCLANPATPDANSMFDAHLFTQLVDYAVYCAYGQLKIPGLAQDALAAFERSFAAFASARPVF